LLKNKRLNFISIVFNSAPSPPIFFYPFSSSSFL